MYVCVCVQVCVPFNCPAVFSERKKGYRYQFLSFTPQEISACCICLPHTYRTRMHLCHPTTHLKLTLLFSQFGERAAGQLCSVHTVTGQGDRGWQNCVSPSTHSSVPGACLRETVLLWLRKPEHGEERDSTDCVGYVCVAHECLCVGSQHTQPNAYCACE